MGDWHQDLVVKNVSEDEIESVIKKILDYLLNTKIISSNKSDNILETDLGYCPGEHWSSAVENPNEHHFLDLLTNGIEIRKGRSVFFTDGQEFESIICPNCSENNIQCEWGNLFIQWIEKENSGGLICKKCDISNSISKYKFKPNWQLSNLGFIFWNWPILNKKFILKLEELIEKKIEKVEEKL